MNLNLEYASIFNDIFMSCQLIISSCHKTDVPILCYKDNESFGPCLLVFDHSTANF